MLSAARNIYSNHVTVPPIQLSRRSDTSRRLSVQTISGQVKTSGMAMLWMTDAKNYRYGIGMPIFIALLTVRQRMFRRRRAVRGSLWPAGSSGMLVLYGATAAVARLDTATYVAHRGAGDAPPACGRQPIAAAAVSASILATCAAAAHNAVLCNRART